MQSKWSKISEKILASTLVFILTGGNLSIIGNSMVVYAANDETQNSGASVSIIDYDYTSVREPEAESNLESTQLKIETNKQVIRNEEEEVEIKFEFGNTFEGATLYNDPVVSLTMPSFVENVEVTNANLLFENELEIENVNVYQAGENKVIRVGLSGTQTRLSSSISGNGSTLVLGAKLTNKQESGTGEIVASIGEDKATTELTSTLQAQTFQPVVSLGADDTGTTNTTSDGGAEGNQQGTATGEQSNEIDEDAKVTISMTPLYDISNRKEGSQVAYVISVQPIEDKLELIENEITGNVEKETIKNVVIKDFLPAGVNLIDSFIDTNSEVVKDNLNYNEETRTITVNIENMTVIDGVKICLTVSVDNLEDNVYQKVISNRAMVTYEGYDKELYSNTIEFNVVKDHLDITKKAENIKSINNVGDTVKFLLSIKNTGATTMNVRAKAIMPDEIKTKEFAFGKKNEMINIISVDQEIRYPQNTIQIGEEYIIEVTGEIAALEMGSSENTKTVQVKASINDQEFVWDVVIENQNNTPTPTQEVTPTPTHAVTPTPTQEITPTPTQEATPTPTQAVTPTPTAKAETYEVSGTAWLDENKDGVMQATEALLSDVNVKLVQANRTIQETKTDKNGNYLFTRLTEGEYQIVFEYDGEKYKVTQYRKTNDIQVNSSAISNEAGKALTDVISVKTDILHINIGLINIPKFDMSLSKLVNKIVVQTKEDTKTYEFNNNYGKVDIHAKYLNGATVLVEYKLIIKNEGELAGTVKSIVDYKPADMAFSTDLNKTWVQDSSGNLYNRDLKDLVIKPGETKEILLVLTKTMTDDNVGLIVNTAELAEVVNSENVKDTDSTPANKKEGEDDISTANVLIGIRTGSEVLYITLAIAVLIIITTGAYIINRKVLKGI